MSKILAIDCGHSTGWAYVVDGELQDYGTIDYMTLTDQLKNLQRKPVDLVVVERVIPHGLGFTSLISTDVMHSVEHAFPKAKFITAGLWKPVMRAEMSEIRNKTLAMKRETGLDKGVITRHVTDSVCIAAYVEMYQQKWLENVN